METKNWATKFIPAFIAGVSSIAFAFADQAKAKFEPKADAYVVVLKKLKGSNEISAALRKESSDLVSEHRLFKKTRYLFRRALKGFTANLTADEIIRLRADSRVLDIKPVDSPFIITLGSDSGGMHNSEPLIQSGEVISEHKLRQGVREFGKALNGFSAVLDSNSLAALDVDPRVRAIEPDGKVILQADEMKDQAGLQRLGVPLFPFAKINGVDVDERFDVDVAVLDSGIDLDHPDLNVFRAVGFVEDQFPSGTYRPGHDWNGHGTGMAGTIGALDNSEGVVGIVSGARLWSVQSIGPNEATWSNVLLGLAYVAEHASEIEVLNCSFVSQGLSPVVAVQEAIRNLVNQGVVVVAGVGNQSRNLIGADRIWGTEDDVLPAGLPEVMAVSSIDPATDLFQPLIGFSSKERPGSFVTSAGGAIDVAAPGVGILSTNLGGGTSIGTGTSDATAHVSGLVALYIAANGRAHDAEGVYRIRQAIVDSALPQSQWARNPRDPDIMHEPLAMPSLSWIPAEPLPSRIISSRMVEEGFEVTLTTQANSLHTVECTENLGSGTWITVETVEGTGEPITVTDKFNSGSVTAQSTAPPSRLYRVKTTALPTGTRR
jgi:hypothetical protein